MQSTHFFRFGSWRSSSRSFASAAPVITRISGVSSAPGVSQRSSIGGVARKSGFASRSGFLRSVGSRKSLSKGAMLADILLVVVWGATIPGLMWLGAVSGF